MDPVPANRSLLPVSFRQEVVAPIMGCVNGGECCAVMGVGSVGKSNLLRHLARPDVRQHYLGDDAPRTLFLNIDANALVEDSVWGYYELMLHRLIQVAEGLDQSWGTRFDPLYQRAVDGSNDRLARRYLERVVGALRGEPHRYRLVFLMDEFDEVFQKVPARLFAGLRALRDDHKYNLVYVASGRQELSQVHAIEGPHEAFYELLHLNTFGLGPYNEQDAQHMVARLFARWDVALDERATKAIVTATQAHPGLIRAVTRAVIDGRVSPRRDNLGVKLLTDQTVRDECRKIWDGLSPEEQHALETVALEGAWVDRDERSLKLLELKKVVTRKDGLPRVFCELFANYVRDDAKVSRLHIDLSRQTVWRGARQQIEDITAQDFKLLSYLYQNCGRVCSRDEIIDAVWGDESAGATYQALHAAVGRLRRKIETDSGEPVYLVTHRDRGYELKNC
jgi:DNA-binding winged helix-turn-helix (wHTH) protein